MSYVKLERCDGPECPRCGCQDAKILEEPDPELGSKSWWGNGVARCKHCGMEFHFHLEGSTCARLGEPVSYERPPRWPPPLAAAMIDRPSTPAAGTGVPYAATTCPNCRSTQTRITSSPRPVGETKIRRHECRECGEKFKSYEKMQNAE